LYTDFLPIPKKEEVVSHPERACAAGRTLHVISEREEHSSSRLYILTKGSKNWESKAGSLSKPLIQM
jgi:hypothetical protein